MSRATARRLAKAHLERGDALGWFEELYRENRTTPSEIPWADARSNPNLVEWLTGSRVAPCEALVVGCGLGDDAWELDRRGFQVTAFDVSPTAIEMCQERFPGSGIHWTAADLFALPPEWQRRFPLVVSLNTLQVFPERAMRRRALECLLGAVGEGGSALLIVRGRSEGDPEGEMPWPLTSGELEPSEGLTLVNFEDYLDAEQPPVRRFRVHYRRVA